MKLFFRNVFRLFFAANIICIAVLTLLLLQMRFPFFLGGDVFAHYIRIALTVKILCFWGVTNIVVVLLYALKYKPKEIYKDLIILWIVMFSMTFFVVGYLLFKDSFLNLFI